MEKILDIKEVHNIKSRNQFNISDGFRITTTKQSILLLIDSEQGCCENWSYFLIEDDFSSFIGADLLDITITDTALNTKIYKDETDGDLYDGDVMFVNLQTTKGILTAYNIHNGYYGHKAIVKSEQLVIEEYL